MNRRTGEGVVRTRTRRRRIGFSLVAFSPAVLLYLSMTCCVRERSHPQPAIAMIDQARATSVPGGLALTIDRTTPNPQALLQEARRRYQADVHCYECTFWRQDQLPHGLTPRQQIDVLYQESPRLVLMTWVGNVGQVRRLLYAAGRYVDEDGQECALIEPANPIARLCASKVPIPIHGGRATKHSRYPVDQFGFGAMLDRMARVNAAAAQRGTLDLRYAGTGRVDGRLTYVIERYLPVAPGTTREGDEAEAKLVVHLDQEWLLPVSVESYADVAGTQLLGRYAFTNVKFHERIDEALYSFWPENMADWIPRGAGPGGESDVSVQKERVR